MFETNTTSIPYWRKCQLWLCVCVAALRRSDRFPNFANFDFKPGKLLAGRPQAAGNRVDRKENLWKKLLGFVGTCGLRGPVLGQ